jgi:hypothetical protein
MKQNLSPYNIYTIEVFHMHLDVLPMKSGFYKVFYQKDLLVDLFPEITASGTYWNGYGRISPLLAEEIGIEISASEI